jgi:GNAT superfamily N-acetyltransferase
MTDTQENVNILIDAWKLLAGRMPGSAITHADGVASMFANITLPFLNMSVVDHATPDDAALAAAFATARERAGTCTFPSLVCVSEDWTSANRDAIATEAGFHPMLWMTGMDAEDLTPLRRPPAAIDIRPIDSEETARDIALINTHAYGMPLEMAEGISNMHIWRGDSYGFVGYENGVPVTCSSAFPVGDTVYIALVATMPGNHGRGLAETVMRHTIEQARQGLGIYRATLHATDMGRPLYQSMGFQVGGRILAYGPAAH